MGTHPIFESDFDCLTDRKMSDAKYSSPITAKLSALQQVQVRLGNSGIRVSPLGIGVGALLIMSLGYYSMSGPVAMVSTHEKVSMKELIMSSIEFAERGGKILVDIGKQADIGEQSKGVHDDVAEGDTKHGLSSTVPHRHTSTLHRSKSGISVPVMPFS